MTRSFRDRMADPRIWFFALTGGILFAAFDRLGYMLKNYGTIWAVSENPWHRTIVHRILLRLPVSVLFVLALFWLLDFLRERTKEGRFAARWICLTGGRFWFAGMWALYFVSFLPAFLGGYPGIFAADAPNQVGWTFSGWLTAHHPLLHTGILCAIFSAARSLGFTDNTAAAVYTVLQMLALSGIFAALSRFLKEEGAPAYLQAGTALFLCLFPFHQLMAVYTTKDTIFAGLLVLCVAEVCRMCVRPPEYFGSRRALLRCGLLFTLLFLFRNNGFHTLILCAPFLLFFLRKYYKKLLPLFCGLLVLYLMYSGPLLQLVGAEPGNEREMYSVVMQTLGRTYVAGGDIRPEEMDVIRPVMDEEALSSYAPNLSDPIKENFHTEAFQENRAEFLKTWVTVGLRNTRIYIDAFLYTTAAFWYPDTEEEYLEFVCFDICEDDPHYPHVTMQPVVPAFHAYYEAIGTDAAFRQIPVLRELFSAGFYFWLLVFAALYALYRREYARLLWTLPLWTYMGTCLLGPSALLRYSYPVMLAAPLLVYFMTAKKRGEANL